MFNYLGLHRNEGSIPFTRSICLQGFGEACSKPSRVISLRFIRFQFFRSTEETSIGDFLISDTVLPMRPLSRQIKR